MKNKTEAIVTTNKKIYHNFEILETYEAGIVLKGSEVKSIRSGKIDIKDAYCIVKKNEIWLINSKIAEYEKATHIKIPIDRPRKLLLHKEEINRIIGKMSQKGLVLKPTKVYFNERGFAKVEIALCKYKKLIDRREEIKEKELKRELEFYKKYGY
ncbi:MAG: SsrA-binding protein SmpB [Elusimicrobiota bacterium]|nr:SsrA-binding protein SmpB [Endomicrobiia bacterium]MCX7910393.1 SsrA-binding protein SmpB [Endomicrobiia bacterium]MDW8165072.1 SsrA-binding protein SmpB [Elusimicrobiota bacterium]